MKKLLEYFILFNIMGAIYYAIEIIYDGTSHWTMYVLGGIIGLLIGGINERLHHIGYLRQSFIALVIILPLEFLTGCMVNIWAFNNGYIAVKVWDYSNLPLNLLGQISLVFAPVFMPVSWLGIFLDDLYRLIVWNEPFPKFKIW